MLCFVVGDTEDTETLAERVREVVAAGADWIQLRERNLDGAPLLAWCERLSQSAREAAAASQRSVRVLVNRRIDVALALGADGIHLGFDGLPTDEARQLIGSERSLGRSTHSLEEIRNQRDQGADYIHLAPIFDPLSKSATRPPLGMDVLETACTKGLPVLAQGGLDPGRAAEACRRGALGVAVTGALLRASDPAAETRAFREALDNAGAGNS